MKRLPAYLTAVAALVLSSLSSAEVPVAGAPTAPAPAAPAPAAKPKQFRGFTMNLYYCRDVEAAKKQIDLLAEMGCTSMNFVFSGRQADVHADTITIPWDNHPTPKEIVTVLKYAKSKGMLVMLMPIVLLEHSGSKDWRGVIEPDDWDTWFHSYTTFMKTIADFAKRGEVDVLSVGSELLSTETYQKQWTAVITEVRKIYKGKLTYSANWDHYHVPTFWDQLDYIAMNNYNELAKTTGVPTAELVKTWGPIKDKILEFVKKQKKPFLFSEVGWHNLQNTIREPWNYVAEGVIDLDEQKRAFESFVAAWKDVTTDEFMGAFVWEWVPNIDASKHRGAYTLQNTPALDIVKEWMKGAAAAK